MRIGTLNVRGIKQGEKQTDLATDFKEYKLDVLCIQETHIRDKGRKTLAGNVELFYTGPSNHSYHGVGIAVSAKRKPVFKEINERICYTRLTTDRITVICAYAPTNKNTKNKPQETEDFYSALSDTISKVPARDALFIAGDFNCQIGALQKEHPDLIGQYTKGSKKDTNSPHLIDLLVQHQLTVTNTKFVHKKSHIATWECNNKYRKNPVRNQIDFILCHKSTFHSVTNSRSYNGIKTNTDHRLVICDIPEIKWYKKFPQQTNKPKLNCEKITHEEDVKNKYQKTVSEKFNKLPKETNAQDRWNKVVAVCTEAAEQTAGKVNNKSKNKSFINNDQLKTLSEKQHKLRLDINSVKEKTSKETLKKERNKILKQIKKTKEKA